MRNKYLYRHNLWIIQENLRACLRSTKILTPFPPDLLGSAGTPHVYLKQRHNVREPSLTLPIWLYSAHTSIRPDSLCWIPSKIDSERLNLLMSLPPSPQIHMLFGIILIVSAIFMNSPGNVGYSQVKLAADARHSAWSCGPSPRMRCNDADAVRSARL